MRRVMQEAGGSLRCCMAASSLGVLLYSRGCFASDSSPSSADVFTTTTEEVDRASWIERAAKVLGAAGRSKRSGEGEERHLGGDEELTTTGMPRCPPGFRVIYEEGSSMFTMVSEPVAIPPLDGGDRSPSLFEDTVYIRCDVSSCFKPVPLQGDDAVVDGVACPEGRQHVFRSAVLHKEASLRLKVGRIKRQEQRRGLMAAVESKRALEANTGLIDERLRRISEQLSSSAGGEGGREGLGFRGEGGVRDVSGGKKLRLICSTRYSDPASPAPASTTAPSRQQPGLSSSSLVQESSDPLIHQRLVNTYKRKVAIEKVAVDEGLEEVPVRFRVGVVMGRRANAADLDGDGARGTTEEVAALVSELSGEPSSSSTPSLPPRGSLRPLTAVALHACCSTVAPAGCLRVDGVSFMHDAGLLLEPSDLAKHSANSLAYQGPRLHQSHLADQLCGGHNRHLNPRAVAPHNTHIKAGNSLDRNPSGSKDFFRPDALPENSIFERFGHWPVHTVSPPLNDAIVTALRARGVNDGLAAFVHQFAQHVYLREKVLWRRKINSALMSLPGWSQQRWE